VSKTPKRSPLQVRLSAALELLQRGEIGPEEALVAVVWPENDRLRDEQVPRERRFYSEELKAEIRRRHAAGESIPRLAGLTGIPFGQVKALCGGGKPPRSELQLF
jgi:hypothetical protein